MTGFKAYECIVCGWTYDERLGDPDQGIPPLTRWEEFPEGFTCPLCAVSKELFEEIRVS